MRLLFGLFLILVSLPLGHACAQEIPRIKARILSFDGKLLTVTSGTTGQTLTIGLMPNTRLMYETKADATSVKPGDYLGATLRKNAGLWQAEEAHLLPEALRGAGEGLYPLPSDASERIITGEVAKNDLPSAQITIAFRGSVGSDGPTCTGRAPRTGGCQGEMTFALPAKVPVVALLAGSKSILTPGKVAAISVIAGPDGHLVTPGLTIENETGGEVLNLAPQSTKGPAKPPGP
ncbi:MAG TPA: hypothetical protein VN718_04990 [Rhizomicrobium sp.]|nr:hypothetical protein [Rhizomicrobium sp.]